MTRKPFVVSVRDDDRSELLRRLAAALEPKPMLGEQTSIYKRDAVKSTLQE